MGVATPQVLQLPRALEEALAYKSERAEEMGVGPDTVASFSHMEKKSPTKPVIAPPGAKPQLVAEDDDDESDKKRKKKEQQLNQMWKLSISRSSLTLIRWIPCTELSTRYFKHLRLWIQLKRRLCGKKRKLDGMLSSSKRFQNFWKMMILWRKPQRLESLN